MNKLKKVFWILMAITVGVATTALWMAFGGRKRPKNELPESTPDFVDPPMPEDVEVVESPFAKYMAKARAVDDKVKKRDDAERISDANERYK